MITTHTARHGLHLSASVLLLLACVSATAAEAGVREFWQGPAPARSTRVAQAQEWRQGFDILDRQVPSLSPSEAAWIKREYDDQIAANGGNFTPRALEAMDSKEFQVRRAREHLDLILPILRQLASSAPSTERKEVTEWARLSSLMADGPFWSAVTQLVKLGIVKAEINGVSDYYHQNHAMWAASVIDRVVVPFLERSR